MDASTWCIPRIFQIYKYKNELKVFQETNNKWGSFRLMSCFFVYKLLCGLPFTKHTIFKFDCKSDILMLYLVKHYFGCGYKTPIKYHVRNSWRWPKM